MDVYVAIDWSRTELVIIVEVDGERHRHKIARRYEPLTAFVEHCRSLAGAEGTVRVAVESGDNSLVSLLQSLHIDVHEVDGKQARRFAESLSSSGAKDDFRDADALCKWLQSPAHRGSPSVPRTPRAAQLNALLSARRNVGTKAIRAISQIRNLLVEVFPSLEPLLNLETDWSCRLLEAVPTWVDGQALSRRRFLSLVRRFGIRPKRVEPLWDALKQPWAPLSPELHRIQSERIRTLVQELVALRTRRKELDRQLEEQTQNDPDAVRLRSVTGAGLVISGTLLEILDLRGGVSNRDDLAVATGCAPVTQQSGQSRSVRMRKAVSPRAAGAAFWLAMQAVRRIPWARTMYAHFCTHRIKPAGALRRIARSLLRIVTSMLRHGTDYDEQRYIAALKRNGVPWALTL